MVKEKLELIAITQRQVAQYGFLLAMLCLFVTVRTVAQWAIKTAMFMLKEVGTLQVDSVQFHLEVKLYLLHSIIHYLGENIANLFLLKLAYGLMITHCGIMLYHCLGCLFSAAAFSLGLSFPLAALYPEAVLLLLFQSSLISLS